MLKANRRDSQPSRGRVGQKQVGPVADPGMNGVLQEPMGHVDRRTDDVAVGADRLAYDLSPMKHHLQVQVADDRTGGADVILRSPGLKASRAKSLVDGAKGPQDRVAPSVERVGRRDGEHRVPFELGDVERWLNAHDDGIQELTKHGVSGRDAIAEVHAVGLFDAGQKRRVTGNVGEEEVTLTGRGIWLDR